MSCGKIPDVSKFYSNAEKKHHNHCRGKARFLCDRAEGCRYSDGKCQLDREISFSNVYINGGFGFGKFCLHKEFTRLFMLIVYPPLYVIIREKEAKEKDPSYSIKFKKIIMCFIYTCMFYFPGLLYAFHYKHTNSDCLM